eukprot:14349297-Heterocapsa_arctica.AAC.1
MKSGAMGSAGRIRLMRRAARPLSPCGWPPRMRRTCRRRRCPASEVPPCRRARAACRPLPRGLGVVRGS